MDTPFSTKAVILQELLSENMYGSAMMTRVQRRTKERLNIGSGSVYPALRALEKDGLIRVRDITEIGRACIYSLTPKGRKVAREQRELAHIIFASDNDVSAEKMDDRLAG